MSIVSKPTTKEYDQNYDRIFGRKDKRSRKPVEPVARSDGQFSKELERPEICKPNQRAEGEVADQNPHRESISYDREGIHDYGRGFIKSGT